jgi:hypothetical protein
MLTPPGNLRYTPIVWNCRTLNQGSPHHWKFSKVHTGPQFAHGYQSSINIRLYTKKCRKISRSLTHHENGHVRSMGQGETRYRKYKRLKLDDGQVAVLLPLQHMGTKIGMICLAKPGRQKTSKRKMFQYYATCATCTPDNGQAYS